MHKVPSVTPSSALAQRIRRTSRRPNRLGGAPTGVISLAMGEPDFDTPEVVVAAAEAGLRNGFTRYELQVGSLELRELLARRLTEAHGSDIGTDEVVVTHGGTAGLASAILATVDPGDRVLIPEPTYSLYADLVAMAGGEVEWVPHRSDGALDTDRIAQRAAGARMLILCNPSNPTGMVISHSQSREVEAILERHGDLLLLSDEAYSDIVYDDVTFRSALDFTAVRDRVIYCNTFSKSYAMTGWRLGYLVARQQFADSIGLVHRSFNGSVNMFVQSAGLAALRHGDEFVRTARGAYQQRRDLVVDELRKIDGVTVNPPQGAFYAFPTFDSDIPSSDVRLKLAEHGVLVRAGSEYGPSGERHIRVSFAADLTQLAEGMARLSTCLRTLR